MTPAFLEYYDKKKIFKIVTGKKLKYYSVVSGQFDTSKSKDDNRFSEADYWIAGQKLPKNLTEAIMLGMIAEVILIMLLI